jgi:hypothetical protein
VRDQITKLLEVRAQFARAFPLADSQEIGFRGNKSADLDVEGVSELKQLVEENSLLAILDVSD